MKKMKIGVVGAGAISDIYLKNMTEMFDNLEVVSICANHLEHAAAKAETYGIRAVTFEEMLADPEIEIIVNLTPVGAHYGIIKAALLAGKHVYTEKTLTDDPKTAEELCALADEMGLYLCSAPDTFLGAALSTARKAIRDGILGDIHSFAISATRNNDLLLSLFSFLRQPGCGILYDYAVYYVTALAALLGPVERVGGIIGRPYPTHVGIIPQKPEFGKTFESPNESQVSAVLKMKSGVTGTLHIDADSDMKDEAYFKIYGTKGVLTLSDPNRFGGDIVFLPISLDPRNESVPEVLTPVNPYSENSRGIGPSEMAESIMIGRPARTDKSLALHVLKVLNGILVGGEEGKFVDIEA